MGKILIVDSSGVFPPLEPINVSQLDPIIITPFSIVFPKYLIVNTVGPRRCLYICVIVEHLRLDGFSLA
jgi:hypothetical protein